MHDCQGPSSVQPGFRLSQHRPTVSDSQDPNQEVSKTYKDHLTNFREEVFTASG